MSNTTFIRHEEKATSEKAIKDVQDAQSILTQAIQIPTDFFVKNFFASTAYFRGDCVGGTMSLACQPDGFCMTKSQLPQLVQCSRILKFERRSRAANEDDHERKAHWSRGGVDITRVLVVNSQSR